MAASSGDMEPMAGTAQHIDGFWQSADDLRLHYRDYAGPKSRPPIICLPGLTRNARDFAHVAERLAGEWRVICPELRGRGESAYAKDPTSYVPQTYLADIEALISDLRLKRFILFGTSLGGILAMLLSATAPKRVAGLLINDIGPIIEQSGFDRIRGYVGRSQSWLTWVHAARGLAEQQGAAFPDYGLVDWIAMAKRASRLTSSGRIVPDYDLKIAEPMRAAIEPLDLWPVYDGLADIPTLLIRGALSDILSAETAKAMAKRHAKARLVTVPNVGHAPMLDEPQSIRAIDAFLKEVAG